VKDLPAWVQILIVVAIVLIGAVALQFTYFGTMRSTIKTKEAALGKLREENNQKAVIQKRLPELEAQIARLEEQLQQLIQILPTRMETDVLVSKMKSLADNYNLAILSIKPKKGKATNLVEEYLFDFQVEGSYHSLAMFFEKLGKMERIVDVKELKIKPLKKKKTTAATIAAQYTAKTFVYTG
jgi:type IV pilus assembly protein PilO